MDTTNTESYMERRKNIYEQIKNTKLNKLTVKQGDQNVKLNLKKDLLNPEIQICDQVLCMLENYAKNNTNSTKAIQDKESSSDTEAKKPIQSPTKKVRFDLNPPQEEKQDDCCSEPSVNNYAENLIPEETPTPQSQEPSSPPQSELPIEPSTSVSSPKEDTVDFHCRLCRIKCNNDKALYEHVARIHGGKGLSTKLILENSNAEEDYATNDEDDYDDMDDDFEDDEAYLSSNSDRSASKKRSSDFYFKSRLGPPPPRPNVAIRVAKVAYYNSKNSKSSKLNPFKSNIFVNGGIRGNFFSQERLPLRSCKIRMKLAQEVVTDSDMQDEFLTNSTEISEFKSTDRNLTQTTQVLRANKSRLLLTQAEIRDFFRSLLDYIPINNENRLDEVLKIKENELKEMESKNISIDSLNSITRTLQEIVLDSKQFGVNLHELKKKLDTKNGKTVSLTIINNILKILLDHYLILAVGVVERVYVAHEFKQHWVIQSMKSRKGRGYYGDREETIIEDEEIENQTEEKEDENRRNRQKKGQDSGEPQPTTSMNNNFKPVCLIPRPWRYIDGLLNRPVLKKMLETIILYLKTYPNSTVEKMSSHFSPVLQPIMTLELLEMLRKLKCVNRIILKRENDCDLFSDFTNGSKFITENEDECDELIELNGDEVYCYSLTQNSIFTFKKVFSN